MFEMLDLDFDLGNGLISFVNKPVESPYPRLFAIAIFPLSFTVCELFTVNVLDIDLDIYRYNERQSNIYMLIEKPHATLYLSAIAMFAPSVTSLRMNSQ